MKSPKTIDNTLKLVAPNPKLHAPITLSWFQSPDGRETLLLMGNSADEIQSPSLEAELSTLNEFVEMEKQNKQLTWMIEFKQKIIGVAWIEFIENHGVKPPSIHIMIGDKDYRGQGIGEKTMMGLMQYIKDNTTFDTIYSRHLSSNHAVHSMNQSLGFLEDGAPYRDKNGLEWQNVKMPI